MCDLFAARSVSQAASYSTARPSRVTDPILAKIKGEVIQKHTELTSLFKGLDSQSRGYVPTAEAMEGFKALKFDLTSDELQYVCNLFDLERCIQ